MLVNQPSLYYRMDRNGDEQGPIGEQELQDLVKEGSLSRQAEVRKAGSTVWIRLGRFLNIPDSQLPERAGASVAELAHLLDGFVIDSSRTEGKASPRFERWYCRVYGKELGPVEVDVLRQMAEQGQITQHDRVRREGEAKWLLADSIDGLFDGLSVRPPKDENSEPGLGISPQRFSKLKPKRKTQQASLPSMPEDELLPVPSEWETPQAASNLSAADTTKAPADALSPMSAGFANAEPSSPSGFPRPTTPASPFGGSLNPGFQKPALVPPPRPSKSGGRSFSMPDLGGSGPIILGVLTVVGVLFLAYAFGVFSSGYELAKGMFESGPTVQEIQQQKSALVDDPNW